MAKRTYREFKSGIFNPKNKIKCGNKDTIFYRSGLELKVMTILDNNPNVILWSSEKIIIPYIKPPDDRPARYYVDFYFKLNVNNECKEFLVEIKPKNQCKPPVDHGNKKKSTLLYEQVMWAINNRKWEAASKWAEKRKMKFIILNEENIDTILGK